MNAQMKAVGRQAGLVFIEDGVYGQRWYSSKCGLDAVEYEKLVKLIVQECSRVAKLAVGTDKVCDVIEQHFGVEE